MFTKYKINNKLTQQKSSIPITNYWLKNLQLHQYITCLLQKRCLSNNILYQENITQLSENSETKVYYGICETTFKLRYANHKKLFNHRNHKSDTELSKEFWRIKDNNCVCYLLFSKTC